VIVEVLLIYFVTDLLLENGADLTLMDQDKSTALHYACMNVSILFSSFGEKIFMPQP